jgi:uncharacterized protein YdeI (BOF family)
MTRMSSMTRTLGSAVALTFLLGAPVFAQTRGYSQDTYRVANRGGFANRMVEGTVASVSHDRNGDHVRLTSGMDLFVPSSIVWTNGGRRFGASTLQAGDYVRMNVYSREGDGRDAQVRSLEILQTNSYYSNERRLNGTVVSIDRRSRMIVLQADNGRTVNVNINNQAIPNVRRGDHVSIAGRMDRGTMMADDIRVGGLRR